MFPYSNRYPYEMNQFQQGPFSYPDVHQASDHQTPPYPAMNQQQPFQYQQQYGYTPDMQAIQQPESLQPPIQPPGMFPPQAMNPYPLPRPQKQQPSQFKSVLSQFKKTNGQYDFNKMFDTAGQMMSTMNQVGSLAKGFTSIFKA
ncbi:YppG family protein [Bacillus sp. NPDC077027]|uniref:YppG family protein n=1 Tax=Bacillus sp. NPDC077027 TaxID=3390548 RepID=UPI003D084E5E